MKRVVQEQITQARAVLNLGSSLRFSINDIGTSLRSAGGQEWTESLGEGKSSRRLSLAVVN
jgi:hypothetical protein